MGESDFITELGNGLYGIFEKLIYYQNVLHSNCICNSSINIT